MRKSVYNAVHEHQTQPFAIKNEHVSPAQRATGSKRGNWPFRRLKGCLICNSPFFLSFHFMPSSPPTLASHLRSPSSFTPSHPKPTHHLSLHPPTKTSMLPNLVHHRAHHLSFSSSQCALGKEQSLRDAPKSDGQLNLKIPTQAWQVPEHFCA